MMRAQSPGQSSLLLLDVIDVLEKKQIPYAIIGAMAVSYYGVPRASMDADAIISLHYDEKIVDKIKEALLKIKLQVIVKKGDSDDPLKGLILVGDQFGNQVDLILGIKGIDKSIFKRVKKDKFQDEDICMISPEDLIAMKIFAGSVKDLNDAKGVLEVSKEHIDQKLLKKLTRQYGEKELKVLEGIL